MHLSQHGRPRCFPVSVRDTLGLGVPQKCQRSVSVRYTRGLSVSPEVSEICECRVQTCFSPTSGTWPDEPHQLQVALEALGKIPACRQGPKHTLLESHVARGPAPGLTEHIPPRSIQGSAFLPEESSQHCGHSHQNLGAPCGRPFP